MSILKDLFLSKKFVVALLAAAASVAAYKGWNVDPTAILTFVSPFFVYIGAQGWADSGKEKAKIESAATLQVQAMAMQHELTMRQLPTAPLTNPFQNNQNPPAATVIEVKKETT